MTSPPVGNAVVLALPSLARHLDALSQHLHTLAIPEGDIAAATLAAAVIASTGEPIGANGAADVYRQIRQNSTQRPDRLHGEPVGPATCSRADNLTFVTV